MQSSAKSWLKYWSTILRYAAWVAASFVIAILVIGLTLLVMKELDIKVGGVSETTLNVAIGAISYGLSLLIVIGLPWLIWKQRTNWRTLGLDRLTSWKDIGLALGGMVVYFVLTVVLALLVTNLITSIDMSQEQDLSGIIPQSTSEMMIVFALLVIVAPVVEEVLFRGYLFGKIRQAGVPFWLTALVVSLLFGAFHMQWNVGIDTFALSLVMCLTREATGSLWPSILMHMTKNGLAFYLLFVSTQSLGILGG